MCLCVCVCVYVCVGLRGRGATQIVPPPSLFYQSRRSKLSERTAETLQRVCSNSSSSSSSCLKEQQLFFFFFFFWKTDLTQLQPRRAVGNVEGAEWSSSRAAHVSQEATGNVFSFSLQEERAVRRSRLKRVWELTVKKCPVTSTRWSVCRDSAGSSWALSCTLWHPGAHIDRTDRGSATHQSRWVACWALYQVKDTSSFFFFLLFLPR